MKKFILPLLLILTVGMLAAVESEPSAIVGYVKYDCVVGNNFIAMPMVQAVSTTTEFGALFGESINTINLWNPSTQAWDSSVNYGDNFWDPELQVGTGSVLFINATNAITYYSIGNMPTTNAQYSIVDGNNTVMVPLNKSELNLTSVAGLSMGPTGEEVNTINLWSSLAQAWDASVNYGAGFWDPDFEISIGTPMFINSNASFIWPSGPRNSLKASNSK